MGENTKRQEILQKKIEKLAPYVSCGVYSNKQLDMMEKAFEGFVNHIASFFENMDELRGNIKEDLDQIK